MANIWLFQALPSYDLNERIPSLLEEGDTWTANTSFRQMNIGDQVVLWQSGISAGVYSFGWIQNRPRKIKGEWIVKLGYAPLLKHPILKSTLQKNPIFDSLKVLGKVAKGTVHRVTDQQWSALTKMIPKAALRRISGVSDELEDVRTRIERADRFSSKDLKDARERQLASIVLRQGQPRFREQLLQAYGRRCAVTLCDVVEALEAAHIIPYFGVKSNRLINGFLLRADIHTLFDLSLMAINPQSKRVTLSKILFDSSYGRYSGKRVRLPKQKFDQPSEQVLMQAYAKFQTEEGKR